MDLEVGVEYKDESCRRAIESFHMMTVVILAFVESGVCSDALIKTVDNQQQLIGLPPVSELCCFRSSAYSSGIPSMYYPRVVWYLGGCLLHECS